MKSMVDVVPHAGTWIEIFMLLATMVRLFVVPHAGTWIEIINTFFRNFPRLRRSPRGNVD